MPQLGDPEQPASVDAEMTTHNGATIVVSVRFREGTNPPSLGVIQAIEQLEQSVIRAQRLGDKLKERGQ